MTTQNSKLAPRHGAGVSVLALVVTAALALCLAAPAEAKSKKSRAKSASAASTLTMPSTAAASSTGASGGTSSSGPGVVVDMSTLPMTGTGDAADISPPAPRGGVSADEYLARKERQIGGAGTGASGPGVGPPLVLFFDQIDTSDDGLLSRDELEAYYATLQDRLDAVMSAAFRQADLNGDGKLDVGELQAVRPALAGLFGEIDANRDGYVTTDELTCRWGPK